LQAQLSVGAASKALPESTTQERLVWRIRLHGAPQSIPGAQEYVPASAPHLDIEPRLQKRRKKGWTGGRTVALRTLSEGANSTTYTTVEDHELTGSVRFDVGWRGERIY
jgi:hypothetical protein